MNRHDRIANDWLREMSSRFAREFGEEEFMGEEHEAAIACREQRILTESDDGMRPSLRTGLPASGLTRPKSCPVCEGKGTVTGVFPWLDPYHERTEICEVCNGTGAER